MATTMLFLLVVKRVEARRSRLLDTARRVHEPGLKPVTAKTPVAAHFECNPAMREGNRIAVYGDSALISGGREKEAA